MNEGMGDFARSVFLSYASADLDTANSVCRFLEGRGVSCWMAPRDVKPGAQYADAIVAAINEAKCLVLVLSGSAVASAHVGREVERAASKRKPIIAFRIDAAPLSRALEYFLSESQWIDAAAGVAALGMPAALAKLAEAVATGSGTSSEPTSVRASASRKNARLVTAAAGVVVVGVALVFGWHLWASKHSAAQAPAVATGPAGAAISGKSIAVLPFVDMSEKHDQEYFADGMAEEILDVLAKVPGLKVIARTSSFQFKGKNEDVRQMGTAVGAAHIVEGSVRRSGERIRVTSQLIRVADGAHEWSESYDRSVDDAIQVQQEIAASLSRALQVTIGAGSISSSGVRNPAAYDLFLRGLQAYDRIDKPGLAQAADYFREALDLEPSFTRADEWLALTHLLQVDNAFVPAEAGWERARADAQHLIKVNPNSMMGHGILARIHTDYDWDWDGAGREIAQVLATNPHDTIVQYAAGVLANALGRWDEAESHFRAALSTDPLDPDTHQILGTVLAGAGRLAEAAEEHRRALEIDPTFAFVHFELALDLLGLRQPQAALQEMQLETLEGGKLSGLSMVYYALGRKADSDAALVELTHDSANDKAYEIALAHAFRGEADEAFDWFERAYRQREFELSYIKSELIATRAIRSDPRYKAFLKKMNLPE